MTRSDARRQAVAGVTTFFTMAYIVVVNPSILATPGTGMPFAGALTATVLVCSVMTLLMGLYADLPFAVAPGMGINAFFAYSIVLGRQVPWQSALGMVFWAGALFLLVSVTPVRQRIAMAIPLNLRTAAAAGIGLFLTFIGLKNAGLVAAHPVTLVQLGPLDRKSVLSMMGLAVIAWGLKRKSPFAFLAGIFSVTAAGWALNLVQLPKQWVSWPDFSSVFLKLDVRGALDWKLFPAIAAILLTDLFDSLSTFVGVSQACGLLDEKGEPKNLREGLIVDALATLGAGLAGSSSGTAYIESAAGIEAGGTTGLTSVVTGLCFLPCFFIGPLAAAVPSWATAPVLIAVGALLFKSVSRLELERFEDAVPAFLTIVLIPLTFSITQGILWGFIAQAALYLITGRGRELKPSLYALAVVAVGLMVLERW